MYLGFLLLSSYIIIQVKSDISICENVCICRYDNKFKGDYRGENIDCSYNNEDILNMNNRTLPSTCYSLDLSSTNLSRVVPSRLLQSETMVELFLNNNQITDIASDSFTLPSLKRLDLSYNLLEFINENIFLNIKNLEYLNLANNNFVTFKKLTFHSLSNLNEIILDGNEIGTSLQKTNLFDRNGYGLTKKIQYLSISNISLNIIKDNFFADAYDIRKLVISKNNISDIFEIPYTLEYLDLSDNPISEISAEDFTDLPALKVLKLNNLQIDEITEYTFEALHSLMELELERNKNLTRFSKMAFGKDVLQDADDFTLERLSLKGSRVSDLHVDLMEPLGRLLSLDLQGNPWKCDCNIIWLKQLQINEKYYDHLRCSSPKSLYNARIFDLDSKYFTCPTNKRHVGAIIAVVTFCVLMTIVALWIFVFIPKYQSRGAIITHMYAPSATYSMLPMTTTHNPMNM